MDVAAVSHALGQGDSMPSAVLNSSLRAGPTPLVPLAQALNGRGLRLHVVLQPIRLNLGQLQSLALGDVIALPQRLDHAVEVLLDPSDEGGISSDMSWQRIGHAALGQVRGQRAVECLASSPH